MQADYNALESQMRDINDIDHHVVNKLLEYFAPIIMKWIEDNPDEVREGKEQYMR